MPALEIISDPGTAFRCRIQGWLQTPQEKEQWQYLVERVVQYAFTSRSVTLITISPAPWSIGESLPVPRRGRASAAEYLVNRVEHCSAELLADVAESEEFQRGLLWLTASDPDDEEQIRAIVNEVDVTSAGPPTLNYELMLVLDDGRSLHWLRPGRDVTTLQGEALSTARRFGWEVSGHPG